MHIGWPQAIIISLFLLGDGMALAKDGEPRTGKHCFWTSVLSTALMSGLLYWGGFFG